jgi:hypothetical protein
LVGHARAAIAIGGSDRVADHACAVGPASSDGVRNFFGKFRERGARVWPGGAFRPNGSIDELEKIF